jgi:hypothetical protein
LDVHQASDRSTNNPTLYARVMGDSWFQIAAPVRSVHAVHPVLRTRGDLRVDRGRHRLVRVLAWMLRLPRPCAAATARLIVTALGDGERWERTFNGRRFETRQRKSNDFELAERYGVLEFRFRLEASGGSLLYVQRDACLLFGWIRLRIPAAWAPRVAAREDPAGPARVNISVRVTLPGIGLLIAYDGSIEVEDTRA